jgi:hypothetical protein
VRDHTLGMGMASLLSPPRSSSRFLMRMERSATWRSTSMSALSEVTSLTFAGAASDIVSCVVMVMGKDKWGKGGG